ncbi:hypothetical protein NEMIN01_1742 [Nematocida minor]|uniref:uncharacterized protein n=1 Tax=Nematocida minor TaxID=1912983 RepID=UPI00221E890C|nr:uncharacterized protein NEMIN01_1742 [Nematocida minor]KAI5191924.1 hypothetical protein NEMIN01_1742 [Nematocida minor]
MKRYREITVLIVCCILKIAEGSNPEDALRERGLAHGISKEKVESLKKEADRLKHTANAPKEGFFTDKKEEDAERYQNKIDELSSLADSLFSFVVGKPSKDYLKDSPDSSLSKLKNFISNKKKENTSELPIFDPKYLTGLLIVLFVLGCNMLLLGYKEKRFNVFAIISFYAFKPIYSFLSNLVKSEKHSALGEYELFLKFREIIEPEMPRLILCSLICAALSGAVCYSIHTFIRFFVFASIGALFLSGPGWDMFMQMESSRKFFIVVGSIAILLVLFRVVQSSIEKYLFLTVFGLFGTLFVLLPVSEILLLGFACPAFILNYGSCLVCSKIPLNVEYTTIAAMTGLSIYMQHSISKKKRYIRR